MRETRSKRQGFALVMGLVLGAKLMGSAGRASGQRSSPDESGQQPRIEVRVYNYAQVSTEILTHAEIEAAEILGNAGIEIIWTNCDPMRMDIGDAAGCNQLLRPTNVGVRILPYLGVVPGTDKKTMGYAVGDLASVSVHLVSEEAAEFGVKPCEVLGPAIAHELGHLLLEMRGHSPTGIMRARWRREDYERTPVAAFKFTPEQAEQMRTEVARRNKMQRAEALPGMAARK